MELGLAVSIQFFDFVSSALGSLATSDKDPSFQKKKFERNSVSLVKKTAFNAGELCVTSLQNYIYRDSSSFSMLEI